MSAVSRNPVDLLRGDKRVECQNCALFRICLPKHVSAADLSSLEAIIIKRKATPRGQPLFKAGDKFSSIYAVRSGGIKTYRTDAEGNEQVCGFHLPGELVGLESIISDTSINSAKMLDTTSVCEIPFPELEALLPRMPQLQKELTRLLSREIVTSQWQLSLLGSKKADARVAALLCNISDRLEQRGYSATRFSLPMSRSDIGNFLGLTIETVSRSFTRLQRKGLLSVKGRMVTLLDLDNLRRLAGHTTLH